MTKNPQRIPIGEFVSIVPRGKRGVWTAEFHWSGEHRRKSLKTSNLKIARPRAAALDRELASGAFKSKPLPKEQKTSTVITISEAIGRYISHCDTSGCRKKTRAKYCGILTKFSEFASLNSVTNLADVDLTLLDKFRKVRKQYLSPKSMHHDGSTLKRFLDWAARRNLVLENPLADETFTPPEPKEKSVLTLDQVNKILTAAPQHQRIPLALLAFSGARSGELQRLLCDDIDPKMNWIKIESRPGAETKSGRSRKVPIHSRLQALLKTLPTKSNGYRFTASPSKLYPDGAHHLNVKRLNESFLLLLKELKIPAGRVNGFTIHSLRHFMRTFAINSRVPERVVDIWLGHEADRRSVQSVYYHLTDAESQRFMEMIPFGIGEPAADAGESGGQK